MKIAEYQQIDTEVFENEIEVEDYNEFGEIIGFHNETIKKSIPVYGLTLRDATPEEEKELKKQEFYEEVNAELTTQKKMELLIQSIPVLDKPTDRPGYAWKPIYNSASRCFGWEEVEDPTYENNEETGSYLKPFTFVSGMTVVSGMWYTDGDNIWEAIKDGQPESFEDREYFEIVGI